MKKYFVMLKLVEESVFIIRNFYKDEFFFKVVLVEFLDKFVVYFLCNLCVYNINYYDIDCVFFSIKVIFLENNLYEFFKGFCVCFLCII